VKENNKRLNSKRDVQNIIGRQTMKEKNIKIEDLLDTDPGLDEAYGSEDEDGDSVYFTTPTSTKKRTPASKRRSLSSRTPSRKLYFSTPVETSPLSLKRKRRAVTSKNYKEDEEDEPEDSDISEYKDENEANEGKSSSKILSNHSRLTTTSPTPTRPRAAPYKPYKQYSDKHLPSTYPAHTLLQEGLPSASGDGALNSGTASYDQADATGSVSYDQTHASGSGSSGQQQRPLSSGSRDQLRNGTGPAASAAKEIKPYEIPGPADDNTNDEIMEYKLILCDLLQVDKALAEIYTLQELRIYARAYNLQFASKPWVMTTHDGSTHICERFRIRTRQRLPNGNPRYIIHFCHWKFKLAHLAVCRGDLKTDATFNPRSKHIAGFSTHGAARLDMALGVIPNPFGMVPPQVLDASHNEGPAGFA
jgi:hypothetical protein